MRRLVNIFARLALGTAFLSAVADRFGLWGKFGTPHVAWGDFARFAAYTARLNWFLPAASIPALAWASTALELIVGVALIFGIYLRYAATATGILLLLFGLAMTFSTGPKGPLDASVFSASAAAFLLALNRP